MPLSHIKMSQTLLALVLGTPIQSNSVYLGLLTAAPTVSNEGVISVTEVPSQISTCYKFNENSNTWVSAVNAKTGYARLQISNVGQSANSLAGEQFFTTPTWNNTNQETNLINSQALQMSSLYPTLKMPRSKVPTVTATADDTNNGRYSWTVTHFALFTGSNSTATCFAYGELTNQVTITEGSVPIFYPGDLEFSLGEGSNS